MARKSPELNLKPELIEPNSEDFNLIYKPQEEPLPAGLEVFAKSLDRFVNEGAVDAYVVGQLKQKKVGEAEATKLFNEVEANKRAFKKQSDIGKIPKEANPYFIDKYKELELNAKAEQFKARIYNEYANKQVLENPDPDAFQKFYQNELKLFISENQLGSYDPVELEKGFFKKTSAAKGQLFNTHVQSQMGKISEQFKTNFINDIQGKFDDRPIEIIGGDISDFIKDAVKNGLSEASAKEYLLDTLMDYASKTGDFEYAEKILRELPKHIQLGTGKFGDIKGLKDDFFQIKDKLEDRKTQEINDDFKRKKNQKELEALEAYDVAETHLTLTDAMAAPEWKTYSNYKQDQIKRVYAGQTVGFSQDQDPNIDSEINGLLAENDIEGALELLTNSIPIVQATYFNLKKEEILAFRISGKDGMLAIREYKYAESRLKELTKIHLESARGQSIKTDIDPMLSEKFKIKAIQWLADNQVQVADTGGYIYSHSQRRQDFEKFITQELKKEEANLVGVVNRDNVTFGEGELEVADKSKIQTGGIAEGRKKEKKFTPKEEKEDDEGVIKTKRLAKTKLR